MSLWSIALSDNELGERRWLDLMPWLDRYGSGRAAALSELAPGDRWWEKQSPAETAASADVPAVCAALARIYVTDHPDMPLADGLADPIDVPVAALDLGTAAATVVDRLPGVATTAALFARTPSDLFAVRGAGPGTVHEIVCAAMVVAILRDPGVLRAPEGAPGGSDTPALDLLISDLAELARWQVLRGHGDRPLLRIHLEDGAPEEIQEVAARITALTAQDLRMPAPQDPVAELGGYVAALPESDRQHLRQRVLGDDLADLSAPSTFPYDTAVGDLLAAVRVQVRPVASLDRIEALFPDLSRQVPGLGVPLRQVLDRLDDRFEVADGWVAVPNLPEAERQTRALLAEFESENGVVEPAAVATLWNLPAGELTAWLQHCGLPMFDGRVLTRQDSLADRAAQVLEVLGDPMSAADLVTRMDTTHDTATVIDEIADDERFAVTESGVWSLVQWETDVPGAVRARIARIVDAAGGSTDTAVLAEALSARFPVSRAAALLFADSGDFEVAGGLVRRRVRDHVRVRSPRRTRRLYRLGDVSRLRITATRDHLRGADFPVPSAVAAIVGCPPGGERMLGSRLGTQVMRWSGATPQLGTVRRFLEDLGVEEDNEVFLEFHPDGHFDVVPLRTVADNADPLRKALALVGHSTPEIVPEDGTAAALAAAIGVDDETRPRRVLSAYRARREIDVVALLEDAWVRVPN
ncbi:hypothetical protein [Rhodococcus phenolicus]|uniref:hypothetical protein n=1 Tax=Rhodococcus phenolicus TaxID=263849 RepID=UPI000831877D|nr:hypothetical protein [Rhodococcus phenolicus]